MIFRIFSGNSVIAFHQVFNNMLIDIDGVESNDLHLLTSTTNAVRLLSRPDKPYSYCTRLHRNLVWCLEIAKIVWRSRKLAHPDSAKSGGRGFGDGTQGTFDAFDSAQKDVTGSYPTIRPKLRHDFDGDLRMDEGPQITKSGLDTNPSDPMFSSLNQSDLSAIQTSLSDDIFSNNDLGPTAQGSMELLPRPMDGSSDSSNRFQDALRWMLETGNDLDSTFQ